MASIVWSRTLQDAHDNPYEYECEKQFIREANEILTILREALLSKNLTFHKDDRSRTKAVWMLQLDAVDTIEESLAALQNSRHRTAAKMFRNITECLDFSHYFEGTESACTKAVQRWYDGIEIKHSEFRMWIEDSLGAEIASQSRVYYFGFSAYTHNRYQALLAGYTLGDGDRLVHDSQTNCRMLAPRQTISAYYVLLSRLVIRAIKQISTSERDHADKIDAAWRTICDSEPCARRFSARSELKKA